MRCVSASSMKIHAVDKPDWQFGSHTRRLVTVRVRRHACEPTCSSREVRVQDLDVGFSG